MPPTIHVITPCSRPQNLPEISSALEACNINYQWHIVFDALPFPIQTPPHADLAWRPSNGEGAWGNLQRNHALQRVNDGFVYFLDDDNLPHPGFFPAVLAQDHPKVVIVNQIRKDGSRRLRANGKVEICAIDTAQAFIPHELIGGILWQADPNPADFFFLRDIYEKHKDKFVFLDKDLSYYNYLRMGGPA